MRQQTMRAPMGVGILTVLMVFVVLLLCSFSVMSLLSANADANLTQKAKTAVATYYEADTKAEQKTAQIAQTLRSSKDWTHDLIDIGVHVSVFVDHAVLAFAIPSGEQNLCVELDQPLRNGMPLGNFKRIKWRISSDIL